MKRIIIIPLTILLFTNLLNAQYKIERILYDAENLDKTQLRCQYKQIFITDSTKGTKKEDVMLLEVGKSLSKYGPLNNSFFYNPELTEKTKLWMDSISKIQGPPALTQFLDYAALFKNYPEGKITAIERLIKPYIYEEQLLTPIWTLSNDTLTVNGYFCKKAKTHFYGRDYEAWYAPEIPVSDGPWKFGGLPGLIFKVEDNNHYFSFECVSVEKEDNSKAIYIDMQKDKIIKTTKKDYSRFIKSYHDNPVSVWGPIVVRDRPGGNVIPNPTNLPYIPLELAQY
jgi:GLPGLI family protein